MIGFARGVVFVACLVACNGSFAWAQDEKTSPQETPSQDMPTPQPEPGPDTSEMEEPAPSATASAPAASPPATEATKEESYVVFLIRAGGPIGIIIIIQSIVTVALTIKYLLEMKREKFIPPRLVAEFEDKIRDRKYQEAYELTRNDSTFLGKVLAAGLSKLSTGYPQAIEAMHETGEDESMKLEHKLSWLAMMGTTGPLLGLFGTVVGMVASFRVIATSETQPKPSELADGISVALVTTLDGMVVAIIATFAFMLLKNQAARLVLEVGMVSGNLMGRFSSMARPGRSSGSGVTEQG